MIGVVLTLSVFMGYSPDFNLPSSRHELMSFHLRPANQVTQVAEKKQKKSDSVIAKNPAVNTVAPLTTEECEGLGGKVLPSAGVCLSTSMCRAKGEDGAIHLVCITKK